MLKQLTLQVLPPILFFFAVIIVWQKSVDYFQISPLILPSPAGIAKVAWVQRMEVLKSLGCTAITAIAGFSLSIAVGSGMAFVFSQSALIRRCAFPFAIALQTVPILAIAPMIILWLGHTAKAIVFVSFLISLFPILTNTTTGLIQVPLLYQDLFRLYRASRWQTLWRLQIPNSLPSFVNGLKVSAGLSVLGSVVGEYIAGSLNHFRGIGYWIYDSQTLRLDQLFVYVLASTVLGVMMFVAVSVIGDRLLLQWQDPKIRTQS